MNPTIIKNKLTINEYNEHNKQLLYLSRLCLVSLQYYTINTTSTNDTPSFKKAIMSSLGKLEANT